jgi:serpin B
MRCLILIALCFVLASATYTTNNRFQSMLNRYQNPGRYQHHQNRYQQNQYGDMENENGLYGSDDTDDYIDDYVSQIRRERQCEQRGQCQGGQYEQEDEYDQTSQYGDEEEFGQQGRRHQYETEDETEGTFGGNRGLIQEVEEANTKLACRLYKQSKDEKDDKNTCVSPLSVQLALAALNQGARGNTRRQIGRVTGGRLQKQERKQVFKTLVRHLKGFRQNEGYSQQSRQQTTKIHPVTGIFITQTTRAQQMFVQQVKRTLGANVQQCSFQRQPQQCRQMINRFVAQKTQGKINHIVPQDAITDNTKMILVNSLNLKAPWGRQVRQQLNVKETKFYPLDTKKVKIVEVLETKGQFKYYEDELVKIVGLPTQQKELTLFVIVPKDKDGLTDVEKLHLQDGVQLKQLLDITEQRHRHVTVQLPKFQIKHKIDVRRTLRKQGVTDAFDPQRADFSGITGVNQYEDEETQGRYGQQTHRRNPFLTSQYEDEETQGGYGRQSRRNPFMTTQFDDEETTYGRQGQFDDEETTMGTEQYQGQEQEHKLHLNKFIHQTTIKISEQGITATTGSQMTEQYEETEGRFGGRRHHGGMGEEMNTFDEITGFNRRESTMGGQTMVKANRAFAFVIKHNPTKQIVMVGRVIDAAQKKVNYVQQTINNVDQL